MSKKNLRELIDEAVSLERDGDFHLEAMHGGWGAGTCYQKDSKHWYNAETPEQAVEKLLRFYLRKLP